MELDHIVYAVPDLAAAARDFARATGVEPAPGGAHPGWGTRNLLVGLGGRAYLEIIGPDPEQEEPGRPRPFGIDGLPGPGAVTWAVRAADLDGAVRRARAAGYDPGEARPMRRQVPGGPLLEWRLTDPDAARPGAVPFLIDWGTPRTRPTPGCPRSARSPSPCTIRTPPRRRGRWPPWACRSASTPARPASRSPWRPRASACPSGRRAPGTEPGPAALPGGGAGVPDGGPRASPQRAGARPSAFRPENGRAGVRRTPAVRPPLPRMRGRPESGCAVSPEPADRAAGTAGRARRRAGPVSPGAGGDRCRLTRLGVAAAVSADPRGDPRPPARPRRPGPAPGPLRRRCRVPVRPDRAGHRAKAPGRSENRTGRMRRGSAAGARESGRVRWDPGPSRGTRMRPPPPVLRAPGPAGPARSGARPAAAAAGSAGPLCGSGGGRAGRGGVGFRPTTCGRGFPEAPAAGGRRFPCGGRTETTGGWDPWQRRPLSRPPREPGSWSRAWPGAPSSGSTSSCTAPRRRSSSTSCSSPRRIRWSR
ncbi:VOC family protein [Nocardiopsis composta]